MPSIEASGAMHVITAIPLEDEKRIKSLAAFLIHQNFDLSDLVKFSINIYKIGRETEAKRNEAFMVGTLADAEQVSIMRAIECCDRNVIKAATMLGIGKTTMYRKLKELNIDYGQKPTEQAPRDEA